MHNYRYSFIGKSIIMKVLFTVVSVLLFYGSVFSQTNDLVKRMNWDEDYCVRVTLQDNSKMVFKVDELYHSNIKDKKDGEATYYPASLKSSLIEKIKGKEFLLDTLQHSYDERIVDNRTLWNAIHTRIGGGWGHFVNCLLFALEKNYVNMKMTKLERPKSNWRPKPMTESYKRTMKWSYYIPETQKLAKKEYKRQRREKKTGDLDRLPASFIEEFQNTNNDEYNDLHVTNYKKKARIDLVKILLASKYLGKDQIDYIGNSVLRAALNYSALQIPSIVILDDMNAAVAMSLDEFGYTVEEIVYSDLERLSEGDIEERNKMIKNYVIQINQVNKKLFKERLSNYYK